MKTFLDKIKSKWRDNKAELLLQVLSIILAITLLCIGFTTTLSAQGDQRAGLTYTAEVGIYEMKLPSTFHYTDFEFSLNFKLTYYDVYCSKIRVSANNGVNNVEFYVSSSNVSNIPVNSYIGIANGDVAYGLSYFISIETSQTLSFADGVRFEDMFGLSTPDLPDEPDPPDTPDDDYIISKGSYIAGSGYTFPSQFISGQLNFTSYNRLTNETIRFSALRVGVRNDIAYIEYFNVEDGVWDDVYADGWQLDSFQSITVLDTASVSEEFYNKFNQIFSPASEYDAGFVAGYDEGFWDGKDEGYEEGYRQGYLQGTDDSGGEGFVGDMIRSVFEGLDACEIYANYSILDLLKTIIGIFGAIWLLKLLAGG